MKKFLCSTIACAAIFASAPAIAEPIAPPATAFGPNWTGFYVGAAFGGGWTHLNVMQSGVSSFTSTSSSQLSQTSLTNISSSSTNLSQTVSTNTMSSASGNKSGAFGDLMIGYSLLVSPSWVAGVQVEGTLSDMSFSTLKVPQIRLQIPMSSLKAPAH
jgi:hypothetical protein